MAKKRIKWPCGKCANIHICNYESSWRSGKENWFCPVLKGYVEQDCGTMKEVRKMSDKKRDRTQSSDRDYKLMMQEQDDAINEEHTRIHDEIMALPHVTTLEVRKLAVAAMAFFGASQAQIMEALNISRAAFYRLYRSHGEYDETSE